MHDWSRRFSAECRNNRAAFAVCAAFYRFRRVPRARSCIWRSNFLSCRRGRIELALPHSQSGNLRMVHNQVRQSQRLCRLARKSRAAPWLRSAFPSAAHSRGCRANWESAPRRRERSGNPNPHPLPAKPHTGRSRIQRRMPQKGGIY